MGVGSKCVICESSDVRVTGGVISRFVAGYALLQPSPVPTHLVTCRACAVRYYDRRYDGGEMERLYKGYRGDRYFEVRNRLEPWYTRSLNAGIGADPDEIAKRRALIRGVLAPHRPDAGRVRIVDIGGDRGQFMPDEPEYERFVFEPSGTDPIEGVRPIAALGEETRGAFDVALLCHVLEHLPDPVGQARDAAECLAPGGLLYVEVPNEPFTVGSLSDRSALHGVILGLCRLPGAQLALEFASLVLKRGLGRIFWPACPVQHEHINFFSEASMREVLVRAGLEPLVCSLTQVEYRVGFPGVWIGLGRKPSA